MDCSQKSFCSPSDKVIHYIHSHFSMSSDLTPRDTAVEGVCNIDLERPTIWIVPDPGWDTAQGIWTPSQQFLLPTCSSPGTLHLGDLQHWSKGNTTPQTSGRRNSSLSSLSAQRLSARTLHFWLSAGIQRPWKSVTQALYPLPVLSKALNTLEAVSPRTGALSLLR